MKCYFNVLIFIVTVFMSFCVFISLFMAVVVPAASVKQASSATAIKFSQLAG